jgi:hypothetical protein
MQRGKSKIIASKEYNIAVHYPNFKSIETKPSKIVIQHGENIGILPEHEVYICALLQFPIV